MLLFVYTTTRKRFVIFTCRYFKLSWNTTALSQSNCRNFSCSSINEDIASPPPITKLPKTSCWKKPWKELFGFQLRQSASRACSSSYLQLRSSSGRSHTSVNVYNFGNLFSISLSIKKSNMYNLITASHFFFSRLFACLHPGCRHNCKQTSSQSELVLRFDSPISGLKQLYMLAFSFSVSVVFAPPFFTSFWSEL